MFYIVEDALFLGFVQIVVYTGAVMMLFLFVLMLIGVDSAESLVETLRGQRLAAVWPASASVCCCSPGSAAVATAGFRANGLRRQANCRQATSTGLRS